MIAYIVRLFVAAAVLASPNAPEGVSGWLMADGGRGSEDVWQVACLTGWASDVNEVPYFRIKHADAQEHRLAHLGTLHAIRARIKTCSENGR